MKVSQKSHGKAIEIIVSAVASIFFIAYSAVKILQMKSIVLYLIVLSLLSAILILVHITSTFYAKKSNVIRTISYGIIIPEIMLAFEMMSWNTFMLAIGLVMVIGILIALFFIIKPIQNTRRYKNIVKYINSGIVFFSLALTPGFIYMLIVFESCRPIAAIKMCEDSGHITEGYSISDKMWSKMNLEGRTEVLSQLVDIEYKKLGLYAVPQIEIVYLPFAINGTTDKNNRIMLSASRISKGTAAEAVDTVTHELFHCYQNDLIQRWKSGEIERTSINSDQVDRIIQYAYEAENYQEGGISDEMYVKYESQALEADAREHALEAVAEYVVD